MKLDPDRNNNFGPLRLCLAVAVLYSHSYDSANGKDRSIEPVRTLNNRITAGSLAVNGFFLISGLLVAQSWFRSRGADEFILKRCARLYPGYVAALAVTIALAASGSTEGPGKYLRRIAWGTSELFGALVFFDNAPGIPPSYQDNPYPNITNASVWTLPFEIRCYALAVAFGITGLLGRPSFVLAVFGISFVSYSAMIAMGSHSGAEGSLWRFTTYFFAGATVAAFGPKRLPLGILAVAVSAIMVSLSLFLGSMAQVVFPVFGSHLILAACYSRPVPGSGWFDRHDLSYGTYLYGWPIQQSIASWAGERVAETLFITALPIVLSISWISWQFIEAPSLSYVKRRYR